MQPILKEWRQLSEAEWRDDPQNRARGWVGVIVWLHVLLIVATPAALLADLRDALSGDIANTFLSEVQPFSLQIAGWTFFYASGLAMLWSIWTRWRYTPELNLGILVTTTASWILVELHFPEPKIASEWFYELVGYLSVLFAFSLAVYLFVGSRPNLMFKRRVPKLSKDPGGKTDNSEH